MIVHQLQGGWPVCGFMWPLVPGRWPKSHRWVSVYDLDLVPPGYECPTCWRLAEEGQEAIGKHLAAVSARVLNIVRKSESDQLVLGDVVAILLHRAETWKKLARTLWLEQKGTIDVDAGEH